MPCCDRCGGDGFIYENETGDLPISRIGSSKVFNIKAWVCPMCGGSGNQQDPQDDSQNDNE